LECRALAKLLWANYSRENWAAVFTWQTISFQRRILRRCAVGFPLTDEDRWPWLERLRELIKRRVTAKENAVLACSALKRAYRQHLRVSTKVKLVYLRGDYALIAEQLSSKAWSFQESSVAAKSVR
jgi:gluconokinase